MDKSGAHVVYLVNDKEKEKEKGALSRDLTPFNTNCIDAIYDFVSTSFLHECCGN